MTPVRAKKGNIGRGMSTSAKDNFRKEKSKKGMFSMSLPPVILLFFSSVMFWLFRKLGTWSRWIKTTSASILNYGQQGMSFAWGTSRFIGWIVLTTSFLTLLPLVLEVKREEKVEEMVSWNNHFRLVY